MVYIQLEHFWRFVIDHWERDLVQLRFNSVLDWETVFFFFLNFFFVSFYRIFYTYFPLLSPVSLTPPPPPLQPPPSAPDKSERPFAPDHLLQTIRSTIPRSWLTQKVRAVLWAERLCTD